MSASGKAGRVPTGPLSWGSRVPCSAGPRRPESRPPTGECGVRAGGGGHVGDASWEILRLQPHTHSRAVATRGLAGPTVFINRSPTGSRWPAPPASLRWSAGLPAPGGGGRGAQLPPPRFCPRSLSPPQLPSPLEQVLVPVLEATVRRCPANAAGKPVLGSRTRASLGLSIV